MTFDRRWLVVALLPVVGGGVAVWRSGVLTRDAVQEAALAEAAALRERGQATFRSFSMVRWPDFPGPDAVRDVLNAAEIEPEAGVSAAALSADAGALLDQSAEFIYHRFMQPSAATYQQWRTARGYVRADADRMRRLGVDVEYAILVGGEFPGYERLDEVFAGLWNGAFEYRGGTSRPLGIASDPTGLAVSFCELRPGGTVQWPTTNGSLGRDVWEGRLVGSHRLWWLDPRGGIRGIQKSHGKVRVGTVSFVLEYHGGERYPMRLVFCQDPESPATWWLSNVQVMNTERERIVMLEM